jgi:hypothetical protein
MIPTVGTQRHNSGMSVTSAGRKGAPAAARQDRDALGRMVERGESLLQFDRDGLVDRVQLLRPVDADDRDRSPFLDADDAHAYGPSLE